MAATRGSAPTIVDVAAAAGVSLATASRALSNYGRVSAVTAERVRLAAIEIGYRPNELARAMRVGSSGTIGLVIIADFTNAFFDRATKSIVDAAKSHGYQVLISNSDEDIEAERLAVQTLLDKQVDGLIVVPSLASAHDHLLPPALGGKPLVVIDRIPDGVAVTSVTTDDRWGTEQAVRHAVSLGHERLGFLVSAFGVHGHTVDRPEPMLSSVTERVDGFSAGARAAGIAKRNQLWVFSEDEPRASETAVSFMLDRPKPPTVIFTSNNDMALAVLKVAGNRRLVIGRDLSLVTVDDSQWAAAIVPGITVVARPVEQLGELAVSCLVNRITDPAQPDEMIVLPTEVIARESVANLKVLPYRESD